MKNIPKEIYLQVDADGETPEDFKDLVEVTWGADKIYDNDLKYVSEKQLKEYIMDAFMDGSSKMATMLSEARCFSEKDAEKYYNEIINI